jgi:hypothetical protein
MSFAKLSSGRAEPAVCAAWVPTGFCAALRHKPLTPQQPARAHGNGPLPQQGPSRPRLRADASPLSVVVHPCTTQHPKVHTIMHREPAAVTVNSAHACCCSTLLEGPTGAYNRCWGPPALQACATRSSQPSLLGAPQFAVPRGPPCMHAAQRAAPAHTSAAGLLGCRQH